MKSRRKLTIAILGAGFILSMFCIGGAIVYRQIAHPGVGPKHIFQVPGDGSLGDEQALDLSKQVLDLDGKDSAALRPVLVDNASAGVKTYLNRQPDSTQVLIDWFDPISGKTWTVILQRDRGVVMGRVQTMN